jgi:hypothetical protein
MVHDDATMPDDDPPASFALPPLPPAMDAWFAVGAERDDDTEVIAYGGDLDGAILDDLGVVDPASLRLALIGYRWVWENGAWIDQADRGAWAPEWVVLDSVNADPIIGDISSPDIPVFEAAHGAGSWNPTPVAPSLAAFIAELEMDHDAGPPPLSPDDFDDLDDWSVWAIDLGPDPMRTLVGLAGYPLFPSFERAELLALRRSLPVQLVDGLTETAARACVAHGAETGAVFEARRADDTRDETQGDAE